MFPNLRSISHSILTKRDYNLMTLLLHPGIESILIPNLHVSHCPSALSLLAEIGRLSPSLKSLFMSTNYLDRGALKQAGSDMVLRMRNLQALCVPDLTVSALLHVLTDENLQYLEIAVPPNEDAAALMTSGTTLRTQISRLTLITSSDASVVHNFVATARPCRLKQFSLFLLGQNTSGASWQRIFRQLSIYCSSTLQSLHITNHHPHNMTRADFQPLLDLGCLTDVAILGLCLSTVDEDLREMALAWPKLRVLEFVLLPVDGQDSRVTSKGIASFLLNCKGLKKCKMTLGSLTISFERLDKCETCHRNIILFCHTHSLDMAISLSWIVPDSCIAVVRYWQSCAMPTLKDAQYYPSHPSPEIVSVTPWDDS